MPFLATGRYRLERGQAEGFGGDPVPFAAEVRTGLIGAVSDQSRNTYDRATGRRGTVRQITARFPAHTDVQSDDRIINEADTTERYTVVDVRQSPNTAWLGDVVCSMTRNTYNPDDDPAPPGGALAPSTSLAPSLTLAPSAGVPA